MKAFLVFSTRITNAVFVIYAREIFNAGLLPDKLTSLRDKTFFMITTKFEAAEFYFISPGTLSLVNSYF